MSAGALLAGYVADLAIGDPRHGHPVAGFGRMALRIEARLYAPSRARGAVFAVALVALPAAASELAARALSGRRLILLVLTWAALGGRSLAREARRIGSLLEAGDLVSARAALPTLVGRDPERLDLAGVSRAVVESLGENTSDAVVGPLLWGALAGPAGVAAYRAAIYAAVRAAGSFAWDSDRAERQEGMVHLIPESRLNVPPLADWHAYQAAMKKDGIVDAPFVPIATGFCRRGDMSVEAALHKP